jgi:hypothetical protein
LKAADAAVRDAAVRALCNWPNAQVADQLWDLASQDGNAQHQRWALRAYIRVTTLDAEQEPAKTLAALQQAMRQARRVEDKQLVLQRCAAVRTLETVQWIAPYLDDPDLQQTACVTIVELAHHRYLRHPNMPVFDPLLERVSTLSHDPAIVERAKRYRLGL